MATKTSRQQTGVPEGPPGHKQKEKTMIFSDQEGRPMSLTRAARPVRPRLVITAALLAVASLVALTAQ
jgi:hypothetical protein